MDLAERWVMVLGATIWGDMPMLDADHLRLVQILSPGFPIGSFAYSQGLETAISDGLIWDAGSLKSWILAMLEHGSGRTDAILLAHARVGDVDYLSDLALSLSPSMERSLETIEQGRAFGSLTNLAKPYPLPIAVGLATRDLQVDTQTVLTLWLQGLAGQLVSVGVRFIPLGQTAGQEVLAALAEPILQIATEAATAPLSAIHSTALGADMATMMHEVQEVRIYRT
jgi:urease accessory protein